MIWSSRLANLSRLSYAFEVHKSGSRDSAILNLQKARKADPSLQKLILVTTEDKLEKFKDEISMLSGDFERFVSYMTIKRAKKALKKLRELKDTLQGAGLMEEVG